MGEQNEFPLSRGADQKATSWNLIPETYEGRVFSGKRRKLSSLHQDCDNTGARPGLSPGRLEGRIGGGEEGRAAPPPTPAAHLRDTDKILSTSILRFSTSFTWPLSGPCFTFSRPIKYKHLGVRSKSRFTPCKERCFKKVDRHVKTGTFPATGRGQRVP